MARRRNKHRRRGEIDMKFQGIALAIATSSLLFASGAVAQYTPTSGSGTCSNSTQCLNATQAGTGAGIVGQAGTSDSSKGVYGIAGNGTSSVGVYGVGGTGSGSSGVLGINYNNGNGVYAYSAGGIALSAGSLGGDGVYGGSVASNGVEGETNVQGASGVYGGNTGAGYGVAGRTTGAGSAIFGDNTSTTGYSGNFTGRVLIQSCIIINGYGTLGTCPSDVRLKTNIEPLTGSLDKLSRLRPVTYEWRNPEVQGGQTGTQYGFIAQEVERAIPEWVSTNDSGFKAVSKKGLDVMLVASVQTLKFENDELRERVKALEAGRRPMISGFAEGSLSIGLLAISAAVVVTRRKQPRERAS